MSTLDELHDWWSLDGDHREGYDRLAPEFELAQTPLEARTRWKASHGDSGNTIEFP